MAVIYVTNPGNDNDIKPNLQTAINSAATSGDTIVLPAGTFAYSGTVSTTKSFTLRGATQARVTWNGFSNNYSAETASLVWDIDPPTILYRTEATDDASLESVAMITWTKSNRNPCGISVTDIEFRSKIPSDVAAPTGVPTRPASDGLSIAEDYGLVFNKCIDFVVTRCKFKYFGNAAVRINHYDDTARGLIYKCDFYKNAKGKDGLGLGYGVVVYGEDVDWDTPSNFGSSNFNFVENCTFNLHRHSIAAGGCALYVGRHNYVQDNLITFNRSCHAFDAHGSRAGSIGGGNYHSTRAVEAYNNKIINTRYYTTGTSYLSGAVINTGNTSGRNEDDLIERGIWLKEAEQLVYNNIIFGYRFGTGVQIEYPNQFGTGYPQLYTMGYASGINGGSGIPNGDDQDSWFWNNTVHIFNGNCSNFYNYNNNLYFKNDRDYHLSAYTYTSATAAAYTYPHPLTLTQNEVTVSTPNNSLVFPVGGSITFTGTPYNFPGSVTGIEFFVNNVSIGTATTATYTRNFTPTTAGTYTLKATGYDTSGNTVTSNPTIFSAFTATGCALFKTSILGNIPIKFGSSIFSSTTLTLAVTAGTVPFTYLWSNSSTSSAITITPSATTVYSVTITDNVGCTATGTTTINVEDVRCNGNYTIMSLVNNVGGASRPLCLPNPVITLVYSHLKENPSRNTYTPIIGT